MVTGEEAGRIFPAALRLLQSLSRLCLALRMEVKEKKRKKRKKEEAKALCHLPYIYSTYMHLDNILRMCTLPYLKVL